MKTLWQPGIYCVLSRLSRVQLFATHVLACTPCTPCSAARQVPLSMGFSRQEYWSGLPFPSPGYLPDPGIKPASLMSPALAGGFFTTSATMGLAKKFVQAFLQDLTNFLANPVFGVIHEMFPFSLSLNDNFFLRLLYKYEYRSRHG